MTIYILIYSLILLAAICDVCNIKNVHKTFWMIILVIILILFRGLRWRTGTDWAQFEEVFNTCTWDVTSYYRDDGNRLDMGWVFINRLTKIFGDYTLFLLITNTFLVGTWAYLSKKLVPKHFLLAFSLVLVSNMFFPVRLQFAAGVFCWTIYYIYEKKYIKALFIYLIVCLFHKSAIMLLPLIPLFVVRIKDSLVFILLVFSLIGEVVSSVFSEYMVLFAALISSLYPELASNIITYSNSTIVGLQEKTPLHIFFSFTLSLLLAIALLKARHKLEEDACKQHMNTVEIRKFNIFLNCFVLYTFISKFFSSESLSNLVRMIEFFTFGYAISLALTYQHLRNRRNNVFLISFIFLYYVVKLKALLNTPYPNEFYPYYSIFDSAIRRLY